MDELCAFNGVEKPFLTWCNEFGASPLQVQALMSQGIPLHEALQVNVRKRNILISMNRQIKPVRQWCEQYGISISTLRRRVNQGMTLQEAFEKTDLRHYTKASQKVVSQQFTMTKPFLEWCSDYLADPLHVRASMSMGYSLEYSLKTAPPGRVNLLPMKVEGHIDTFLNLCARHKVASNTVRRRVSSGLTLEDAFCHKLLRNKEIERMQKEDRANESYTITQSFTNWCKDYHQSPPAVQKRMESGLSIEQALVFQWERVEIRGELVELPEACKRLNVDVQAVKQRIQKGLSAADAIEEALRRKIKGRMPIDVDVFKQAREASGLTIQQIASRCYLARNVRFTKDILQNISYGIRNVSPLECRALCEVLHILPDELCPLLKNGHESSFNDLSNK